MSMRDCLLLLREEVCKALEEVAAKATASGNKEDAELATHSAKYFRQLRRYYDVMTDRSMLFDEKVRLLYGNENSPNCDSLLNFLVDWQTSRAANANKLHPKTYLHLTTTILGLRGLQQFYRSRNLNTSVIRTSVLSTLLVEHGFSLAREVNSTFTVFGYCCRVARLQYDLAMRKAKATRFFSMPTDNNDETSCYGAVDADIPVPDFNVNKNQRSKELRKEDVIRRHQVKQRALTFKCKYNLKTGSYLFSVSSGDKDSRATCNSWRCAKFSVPRRWMRGHLSSSRESREPSGQKARLSSRRSKREGN